MDESQSAPMMETVCGSVIRDPDKYPSAIYRGEVVYFCTGGCLRAFEGEPDRLLLGRSSIPRTTISNY